MRLKPKTGHLCPDCNPDLIEIGLLSTSLCLAYDKNKSKFCVVAVECGGQVYIWFSKKPFPPPKWARRRRGETTWQYDKRYNALPDEVVLADMKWVSHAPAISIDLQDAFLIVEEFRHAGWSRREGNMRLWLFERCGDLVAAYEKKHPKAPWTRKPKKHRGSR